MRKRNLLYYGALLLTLPVAAQNRLTTVYNAANGLPSSNVYETLVDQQGFLWVATDNGLCRFDGTRFTVYTTAHGLPENEVPDIDMDSNGIVWGLPFIKTPVYFNREKGRFENELTDTLLAKIQPGGANNLYSLNDGGIAISGKNNEVFVIRNNRLAYTVTMPVYGAIRMICETAPGRILVLAGNHIVLCQNGAIIKIKRLPFVPGVGRSCFYRGHLYMTNGNSIYNYTCNDGWPADTAAVTAFPFPVYYLGNTGKHFYIISGTGGVYLLDYSTLSMIPNGNIYNGVDVIAILEDDNDNIWLSTHNDGLLRLQPKRIGPYDWPAAMSANFNAVAWDGDRIMAGNNKGEVIILTLPFNVQVLQLSPQRRFSAWVRRIIPFPNAVFVATQGGDFWLHRQSNGRYTSHAANNGWLGGYKTALRINDSLLVTGSHAITALWNVPGRQLQDTVHKRVTALGNIGRRVFVGSTDGVYEWQQHKQLVKLAGWRTSGLQYRVAALCGTADSLLWVGLSVDSVLVWRHNKIIAAMPLGQDISGGACKAFYSNRPGSIWLGTDKGLAHIRYTLQEETLVYNTTWFGLADGLANNNVNDITIHNDTVYVATAGGINYLPARLPQTLNEIPVVINNVVAAGQSQGAVSRIRLPYGQGNIRVEYSGIDLSGYTHRFAYRVNNAAWQYTEQNFIELQCSPGTYSIEIAAINRNGQPSVKGTRLQVVMKIPYWKTSWFWFGVFSLVVFISFWIVLRNIRRKRLAQQQQTENEKRLMAAEMSRMAAEQKAAEEKLVAEKKLAELEMQALRAQINPHFVFNCLNSIKGFIHEKDFVQADRYLDAFSILLRNTLENSIDGFITLQQEIEYLHNYLELEQLRFNNQFIYTINTDALPGTPGILVPAMLIQPYVENAIRHGIRHLQNKQGRIGVTFRMSGLSIECTIEDNGVGREKGAAMRSAQHIEYQGRGMQISQRRAQLYQATVTVTDRLHPDGSAAGTTVTITTPLVKR